MKGEDNCPIAMTSLRQRKFRDVRREIIGCSRGFSAVGEF